MLLTPRQYPILRAFYNIYFHPLSKVPGPYAWSASRLPFIYSLLKGTLIHDIQKLHRKYGPILRIAPDEVTFAQPEAWSDIFQLRSDHQQFLKDPVWWRRQPGHPDSLISVINPDAHARMRRLLAPGFTPRALTSQEPILHHYANLLVERLNEQVGESTNGIEIDMVSEQLYPLSATALGKRKATRS